MGARATLISRPQPPHNAGFQTVILVGVGGPSAKLPTFPGLFLTRSSTFFMSGPAGHPHCLRVDIDPELTLTPRDGSSPQAQRPGSMSQATQRMQWQDDSGGMPSKLTVRSASPSVSSATASVPRV